MYIFLDINFSLVFIISRDNGEVENTIHGIDYNEIAFGIFVGAFSRMLRPLLQRLLNVSFRNVSIAKSLQSMLRIPYPHCITLSIRLVR